MGSPLIDFLLTGKIGPVYLGRHVDDLLALLGLPTIFDTIDDFRLSIARTRDFKARSYVVRYGALELYFDKDDRLSSFILHCPEGRDRDYPYPEILNMDWLNTLFGMNSDALKKLAEQHDIRIERVLLPDLRNNVLGIWIPESRILVRFTDINGSDIYSILREDRDVKYPGIGY